MNVDRKKKYLAVLIALSVLVGCESRASGELGREGNSILALVLEPSKETPKESVAKENKLSGAEKKTVDNNRTKLNVLSEEPSPQADCVTSCVVFRPMLCDAGYQPLICEVTYFPDNGPPVKKYPPADCFRGNNLIEASKSAKSYYAYVFCRGDGGKVP
ncbi:hypothetical protein JWG45_01855 [Leptospira sp. 201903070]|uniref:Lipoprotein n=1 Tax=Leptospira ainlahdjerensis TaxID=2810033 RepID=A0ABS2U693_9LEPT|nr:hypothetical protein [Leptospira ainlahdjerensis]MBM9575887.1 hypothetical protein [Leptospira ainlahdjerensis]